MNGFFVYLYALAVLFLGYVLAFTLTGARSLVVYNHKSHGSLTIRLGALVFSAGALCYFGLETVSFAEVRSESPCYKPTLGANVALALAFVALQTYVIFVYPRLNLGISPAIDRCAKRLSLFPPLCLRKFCSQFPFSRFGLMHLVATNIILWIRTLLKESLHEISESEEEAHEGELGEGGAGRTEATATPRSGTEHLFNRPAHDHGNCSFMIDRIRQYEHKQVQDKGREEGRTELKGGFTTTCTTLYVDGVPQVPRRPSRRRPPPQLPLPLPVRHRVRPHRRQRGLRHVETRREEVRSVRLSVGLICIIQRSVSLFYPQFQFQARRVPPGAATEPEGVHTQGRLQPLLQGKRGQREGGSKVSLNPPPTPTTIPKLCIWRGE